MCMMKSVLKNSQNRKISGKKSIACHTGKQMMLQSWSHHNPVTLEVSPEGIQDRNQSPPSSRQKLQPPPRVYPEETQDEKNTGYWSQIAVVPNKGMVLVSPDLHFSIHRKVLSSLTEVSGFL